MSVLDEKSIRDKIKEYVEQRDTFATQANQQIAALNGAIQALEALLAPPARQAKPAKPKPARQAKQAGPAELEKLPEQPPSS